MYIHPKSDKCSLNAAKVNQPDMEKRRNNEESRRKIRVQRSKELQLTLNNSSPSFIVWLLGVQEVERF